MKIVKILVVLAVLALLLVGALVAGAYFFRGSIIKQVIERGGTYATGVETTLDSAELEFGPPSLTLDGLQVANPDGFDSPYFLRIDDGSTAFDTDAGEVGTLAFDGVDMYLDGVGEGSNYNTILANLDRFESGDGDAAGSDADSNLVIRSLVIENVEVHVRNVPGLAQLTGDVAIEIPRVELNDLGEEPMSWGEMFSLVIKTLVTATIENGGGILPANMLDNLSGSLGQLASLDGEVVTRLTEGARDALDGARDRVDDAVEGAKDKAGEAVDNARDKARDAIGGFLGGNKDEDDAESDTEDDTENGQP